MASLFGGLASARAQAVQGQNETRMLEHELSRQMEQDAETRQQRTLEEALGQQRMEGMRLQNRQLLQELENPTPKVRSIDPLSSEGISARVGLEQRLSGIPPRRGENGEPVVTPAQKRAGRQLKTVGQQIDDTRQERNAARSAVPKKNEYGYDSYTGFTHPKDSIDFVRDTSSANAKVRSHQSRLDSLSGVRDSLSRVESGDPVEPRAAVARTEQDEYAEAAQTFKNVLQIPGVDRAQAQSLYDQAVLNIAAKHGKVSPQQLEQIRARSRSGGIDL